MFKVSLSQNKINMLIEEVLQEGAEIDKSGIQGTIDEAKKYNSQLGEIFGAEFDPDKNLFVFGEAKGLFKKKFSYVIIFLEDKMLFWEQNLKIVYVLPYIGVQSVKRENNRIIMRKNGDYLDTVVESVYAEFLESLILKIMKFVEEQLAIYKQKELKEQKRKEEEDKKAREAARKNLIETHIGYLRDYKVLAQYKTKITVEQDNNFRKIITDLGGKVTHKKNITNAIVDTEYASIAGLLVDDMLGVLLLPDEHSFLKAYEQGKAIGIEVAPQLIINGKAVSIEDIG